MTIQRLFLITALASPLLTSSMVSAQDQQWACAEEVKQFCPDVEPGGGRVAKCLYENQSSLSAECSTQLDELMGRVKGFVDICRNDIEQYCADVQPGGGRVNKCLYERRTDLSAECGNAVDKMTSGGG